MLKPPPKERPLPALTGNIQGIIEATCPRMYERMEKDGTLEDYLQGLAEMAQATYVKGKAKGLHRDQIEELVQELYPRSESETPEPEDED